MIRGRRGRDRKGPQRVWLQGYVSAKDGKSDDDLGPNLGS